MTGQEDLARQSALAAQMPRRSWAAVASSVGRVHTVTSSGVYVGVSASDDALLAALDDAVAHVLPLRLTALVEVSSGDMRRVGALAAGLFPAWRWLWSLSPSGLGSADLFHVQQEGWV